MSVSRHYLVLIVLILLVLAVFGQSVTFEFLNYDDVDYITANQHVKEGLTLKTIIWAFTKFHAGNWHPLTWISHMVDVQFFGMAPWGHHLVNVLLHAANTLLLYLVLRGMTGALWKSAFVAALFAIHPLHIESVAWVAERKDVLSTLFFMLTVGAYFRYAKKPALGRYLMVITAFGLGLMAKPMLITLPFVLLLLDYWPLKRTSGSTGGAENRSKDFFQPKILGNLLYEKIPLFVLTIASAIITYFAQTTDIKDMVETTFPIRVANALISYAVYLVKMIYPSNLAIFYPHPLGDISLWKIGVSTLFLLTATLAVLWQARRRPYLGMGWFWYVVTLVPVIGLVQVGGQAMADRYTYIPSIGIFILVTWFVDEVTSGLRYRKILLSGAVGFVVIALLVASIRQASLWKDSATLMEHTAAVTEGNYIALNNLGSALLDMGKVEEAVKRLQQSIRAKPEHANAIYNLGNAFMEQEKYQEAAGLYTRALRFTPNDADTHFQLGMALLKMKRYDEAGRRLEYVVQTFPDYTAAREALGAILGEQGKEEEARKYIAESIQKSPEIRVKVNTKTGDNFLEEGNIEKAIYHYRQALKINPDFERAQEGLQKALEMKKKLSSKPD